MELMSADNFFSSYDSLKASEQCRVGNIFQSSDELLDIVNHCNCRFLRTGKSIFLLVPVHENLDELFFISANPESFASDIPVLFSHFTDFASIKASIIGKEETVGELVGILANNGFVTVKKLLRIRLGLPNSKIVASMRMLAEEYVPYAAFAEEKDAEEILDIILEEFDLVGDNVPNLDGIRKNIRKKNVTVLRIDGTIASVHYFRVEKGISHGYFDITRKGFRGGNGFIFALNIFEIDYFKKMNIKITRSYGWRDAAKTRLVKSSAKTNAFPDGVVIYNMLRRA